LNGRIDDARVNRILNLESAGAQKTSTLSKENVRLWGAMMIMVIVAPEHGIEMF